MFLQPERGELHTSGQQAVGLRPVSVSLQRLHSNSPGLSYSESGPNPAN